MSDLPGPAFARDGETVHYRGRIISVATGSFRGPDGDRFERDVVHHPGAVAVVPLTDDGEVVLVRQYRAPLDDWFVEIPAGIRDVDHEPAEATAARELAEEVGLAADRFELLTTFHNSPGFSDEAVVIFLATGLRPVPAQAHGVEEEHMTVERRPLAELVAAVERGSLTDAKTVIGVLLAAARSS